MKKSLRYAALRRAHAVLTSGNLSVYPASRRTAALVKEVAGFRARQQAWMQDSGVQGFGISERVRGRRSLRTLCLVVYVESKPKGKKDRAGLAHPVPRTLTVPRLGRFTTDVVAVGRIQFHALNDVVRPPSPSVEIGVGVEAGTLGTWVRSTADSSVMLLTCAHVLTQEYAAGAVHPVMQPSLARQGVLGPGSYKIAGLGGVFISAVPATPDETVDHLVDAGVARISPAIRTDLQIPLLNVTPVGSAVAAREDVRLVGAVTGLVTGASSGPVKDIDATLSVTLKTPGPGGVPRVLKFKDLCRAEYACAKGDSGALVINAADQVVGLHMAGEGNVGYFCKFKNIETALGIELIKPPGQ